MLGSGYGYGCVHFDFDRLGFAMVWVFEPIELVCGFEQGSLGGEEMQNYDGRMHGCKMAGWMDKT